MFILYQHRSWLNDYQLGLRTMVIFCRKEKNMMFISYSVITIATDDLAMQWAGTHFSCDPFY